MFGNPMEIAMIVGAAVLLFGADKLPKLAKSAGQAKKEFMVGQAEADIAAEHAREEARMRMEAMRANQAVAPTVNGAGVTTPPPDPISGTSPSAAPPLSHPG